MAVEKIGDGPNAGYVVTGYHIDIFRIRRIESALALEVRHPAMKMSRGVSAMNLAKGVCGSPKRTKRGVLVDLVAWCGLHVPDYTPMPSTRKALGLDDA